MTNFKKNVTRSDVSGNLVDWIRKGIGFSTPVRNTGMFTTQGYYGGLRCATISGKLVVEDLPKPNVIGAYKTASYVVYSYETPILIVHFRDYGDGLVLHSADFDNRKYSATTNLMQGYCQWALRELFHLPWIPDIIGKRGGRRVRRNYMLVFGNDTQGFSWGVLEPSTGEIVPLREDGDTYVNDDTEGYY